MALVQVAYWSDALRKDHACHVLLPNESEGPFDVLFLLHGLSDDSSAWTRKSLVERHVQGRQLVVVMPDGGRGFYTDAKVAGAKWETALAVELPKLVRRWFHVARGPWAVAGLSMGGYGALKFALKHPETFDRGVSMSGALLFGSGEDWRDDDFAREFQPVLGDSPKGGPDDLLAIAKGLDPAKAPRLRIDCGTEDFLLGQNRSFHEGAPLEHEYEELGGGHTWDYWDRQVQVALEFIAGPKR
ncbi:MAG: hypothetical protein KIT11_05750 [Fimbriimonadaceae bacterium]|nr:hypothetical protein [Fimbriimonadaceae bacterium]QYK56603.1 MAG: hypothetical protein KF733_03765 [Fimbriimonadaceae bacterium]